MPTFRKPTDEQVRSLLDAQRELAFTYADVGATARRPPAGFVVDHTRVRLGQGEATFAAASAALARWEQFRLGWLEARPGDAAIKAGQAVAVVALVFGTWWVCPCRIVYVVDETRPARRFGFAYGTLPAHAESGEERFLVEMDAAGDVWFDVLAFSRPRHVLARLGYPLVRVLQKRFGRCAAVSIQRAVERVDEEASCPTR